MDVSRALVSAITTRAEELLLLTPGCAEIRSCLPGTFPLETAERCWDTLSKLLLIHEEARHPLQQWEQMSITKAKDWQVGDITVHVGLNKRALLNHEHKGKTHWQATIYPYNVLNYVRQTNSSLTWWSLWQLIHPKLQFWTWPMRTNMACSIEKVWLQRRFLHTEVRDEWFCHWENIFPNRDELFHCDIWPLIERLLDHSPALLT